MTVLKALQKTLIMVGFCADTMYSFSRGSYKDVVPGRLYFFSLMPRAISLVDLVNYRPWISFLTAAGVHQR